MNPVVDLPEPLLLGLHALGELGSDQGDCMTTREIAAKIGTTEPYLSKVLQRLNKSGFIMSLRGPGGGYVLNCNPEETELAPIFELLGGSFEPRACTVGCNRKPCFISSMLNELSRAMCAYLVSRKLSEFIWFYQNSGQVSIDINVTPKTQMK